MSVEGFAEGQFAEVQEEFERNFAERGELGASLCVMVDGRQVVDLWGGVADPGTGRPWDKDTLCLVWSCGKGAAAFCAHVLIDRGQLDLETTVAHYWPEFAANGKAAVTVRMLLSHQAGIAHLREPLPEGAFRDWDAMAARVAAEAPFWEPGTRHGYHGHTFGWLVGELVRRVDGRSLGQFLSEEITGPLGVDFWIGTPEAEHYRIAPNQPPPMPDLTQPLPEFFATAFTEPASIPGLLMLNHGGYVTDPNQPENWSAQIPSGNGVTNGRGLAGLYNPLALGGATDEVRLVGPDTVARMTTVVSAGDVDACLGIPSRFSLGFMKAISNRRALGPEDVVVMSDAAFGHAGMGGALGFADPVARMSFGYAMNQQGATMLLNDRGQSLVDATYRALGYRSRSSGVWA